MKWNAYAATLRPERSLNKFWLPKADNNFGYSSKISVAKAFIQLPNDVMYIKTEEAF